jgi:hypothetical protein
MTDKKPAAKADDSKAKITAKITPSAQTESVELKDNPVNPARPQDPKTEDPNTPKVYTSAGDAVPITYDPLLSPEAQQSGESAEHYAARGGNPNPTEGVYNAVITRGDAPLA